VPLLPVPFLPVPLLPKIYLLKNAIGLGQLFYQKVMQNHCIIYNKLFTNVDNSPSIHFQQPHGKVRSTYRKTVEKIYFPTNLHHTVDAFPFW